MTSRGANTYERTFMEGFLRPDIGLENWVTRTNYPALGVVPTSDSEMSFYANCHYGMPTACVRRYSLRLDGFVSLRAPYDGGQMVTRPLVFSGKKLVVNYATSAAGSLRVEIQDVDGNPMEGYRLEDSRTLIGNRIEWTVSWAGGEDVSQLAGTPVRLRFVLKDADLYSIRFIP